MKRALFSIAALVFVTAIVSSARILADAHVQTAATSAARRQPRMRRHDVIIRFPPWRWLHTPAAVETE